MLSVQVTFSNGQKFEIPSTVIAQPRAEYYASRESNEEDKLKMFDSEMQIGMTDGDELLDWVQNNMDWKDVKHAAKKLPMHDKDVDFAKEFTNADFEILEVKAP